MSRRRAIVRRAILTAAIVSSPLAAQSTAQSRAQSTPTCGANAQRASAALETAWTALRGGKLSRADSIFRSARSLCRTAEAETGVAYVALRRNQLDAARAAFEAALSLLPSSYDALSGRGMLAYREGDLAMARRMFERALQRVPGDSTSKWYLARLPIAIDTTPLPPPRRAQQTIIAARAGVRRLEVPDGRGGFRPLWVKAVNIGAALPGRHPSEFPSDDGTYQSWLSLVDSMGGNAVRVYTIHPPHFYRALAAWNRAHPTHPIWLIHGVWTELPPGAAEERYDDAAWAEQFRAEMRRVVDLLHGHAAIAARPGHAAGRYDSDVSRWTLGYIIGREWEPYSVTAFAQAHPDHSSFKGSYITLDGGNAVETWLAEVSDYMVSYEMQRYNVQRPLAYTNWPTLDPLHHPTEATSEEESRLLGQAGVSLPEQSREYDNDAIGLDAVKMRATLAYSAGVFASYHAYPYYPDFMVVDPGYLQARSPEGPSAYFGYLHELVEHHGDMPVVISEYGVPSSRGNAHVQPQGWNHGGHSETEQAAIDARLTRDIHASGAAGAGLFAIIDEWFKKNWIVIDFEQPLERNRLWLNALDAEQNYGVVAMRAGSSDSVITIDGNPADWKGRRAWYAAPDDTTLSPALRLRELGVAHDAAYVYLRLAVGDVDWTRGRYLIGISTIGDSLGDRRLPYTGMPAPAGLEFVVDLKDTTDSRVLVDAPYDLYRRVPIPGSVPPVSMSVYNRPFRSVPNDDGRYDTLWVTTNRRRIGRDGTVFPEQRYDRNRLLYARQQETTLADWHADRTSGTVEVRIPWGMLHVLDPSSHFVLQGKPTSFDPEGATTAGFRFVVQSFDPRDPSTRGDVLPRGSRPGTFGAAPLWQWAGWDEPSWHAEVKPLFRAMRETFAGIPDARPSPTTRAAPPRF